MPLKGWHHTEKTKTRIAMTKRGVSIWPDGRSQEDKEKIAAAQRGVPKGPHSHHRVYSVKSCGKAHQWCRECNPEAAARQSAQQRYAWAHGKTAPGGPPTGIHQKLAAFLRACGITDLRWEEPFGRYRVDLYSPALHLAFEADGYAWHERHPFRDQLTRDLRRDAALLREHDLNVIRFSEAEIEKLEV